MRHRSHLPSPAMAVACLALLIALGGTSYAAVKIPDKSVGRAQLRNGAVGLATIRKDSVDSTKIVNGSLAAKDLRRDSVDSSKIVNGSVAAKDLRAGVVPAASVSTVRRASGDVVTVGAVGSATAECKAGEHATGGGGGFAGPPTTGDSVSESIPVGKAAATVKWRTSLRNGGESPRTPVAYVICATG